MKFNKLTEKAKQLIDSRGGMDALKEDLQEVKDVATSRGSLSDKARAAADAVKTPGKNPEAPHSGAARPAPEQETPPAPPATPPAVPPTQPPNAA